ncbi:hypothetical protein [Geminicoccus flavidas]|uniref:hypothetical protein n=1 Tax=Geminicoccus flavidas TaxID=2506407 RepID=UPI00135A1450|nr:hypothetical protein [Geminicoccus flavidas]
MDNLPATIDHGAPVAHSPFARLAAHDGRNVGAVAIESDRAIAEAQGQLTLAKKFPRSMTAAIAEFTDTCNSPEFAATAFYSVPNRGSGPSIRFAEEAARCYGNFQYGHRELSRVPAGPGPHEYGRSEVEVFAWDMQNNNYSKRQVTVVHVRDTSHGPKKLTDQTDIDNRIANVASKQMRGRILALLPKHMVAIGQDVCKRTIAGGGETPLRERLIKMAAAFAKYGVNDKHLVAYLGHPVDDTTVDELGDLMGIYNALREGAKASDYFKLDGEAEVVDDSETAAAKAVVNKQQAAKSADKPVTAKKAEKPVHTAGNAAAAQQAAQTDSKPAQKVSKPEEEEPKEAAVEQAASVPETSQSPAATPEEKDVF